METKQLLDLILPFFYSLVACVGYCLIVNIHGSTIFWASLGGAIGWTVYLLFGGLHNDIAQSFLAILALSAYSEAMARRRKAPVTVYLIVALIPLVPGGGIYYAMEYCIAGDTMAFLNTTLHTLSIAGAIALGILLVSSLVRLFGKVRSREKSAGPQGTGA